MTILQLKFVDDALPRKAKQSSSKNDLWHFGGSPPDKWTLRNANKDLIILRFVGFYLLYQYSSMVNILVTPKTM